MFDLLAGLALGYLVGSFPSALIVGRLWGRDIFRVGSGNMGAMNTARNIGWAAGALVLLLDVAKGALPVALAVLLGGGGGSGQQLMALAAAVGAVAGHAWSAYANFRGGKALATTLGASLPLYPLAGIYTMLLLASLALLTRRAGVAAVAAALAYPVILMAVLSRTGAQQEQAFPMLTSVLLISLIMILKHLPTRRDRPGDD